MQVLSMRLVEDIPVEEVAPRVNAQLSSALGLVTAARADRKFHAGFSANGKEYRYRLVTPVAAAQRPQWRQWAWEADFDETRLREALALFPGTRNYIGFSQKADPQHLRTVSALEVETLQSGVLDLRVHGSGFAKYMIRYIVSAAVLYAQQKVSLQQVVDALETGAHLKADKAPAQGLVLWQVKYPPELDPFSAEERARAALPAGLPFFV